jgi:hypothetical protein
MIANRLHTLLTATLVPGLLLFSAIARAEDTPTETCPTTHQTALRDGQTSPHGNCAWKARSCPTPLGYVPASPDPLPGTMDKKPDKHGSHGLLARP